MEKIFFLSHQNKSSHFFFVFWETKKSSPATFFFFSSSAENKWESVLGIRRMSADAAQLLLNLYSQIEREEIEKEMGKW